MHIKTKKQKDKVKLLVRDAKSKVWKEGCKIEEDAGGNLKLLYRSKKCVKRKEEVTKKSLSGDNEILTR